MHFDHDHTCCPTTPKASCGVCFRGWVCGSCNTSDARPPSLVGGRYSTSFDPERFIRATELIKVALGEDQARQGFGDWISTANQLSALLPKGHHDRPE